MRGCGHCGKEQGDCEDAQHPEVWVPQIHGAGLERHSVQKTVRGLERGGWSTGLLLLVFLMWLVGPMLY